LGILIGAFLTGNAFLFFKQTIIHAYKVIGNHPLQRMLVSELQSSSGDIFMAITVLGFIAWRKLRGAWTIKSIYNPVFILAVLCWLLGMVSRRYWLDIGMSAAVAWMAFEFEDAISLKINYFSWNRLILSLCIVGALYIAYRPTITADGPAT